MSLTIEQQEMTDELVFKRYGGSAGGNHFGEEE